MGEEIGWSGPLIGDEGPPEPRQIVEIGLERIDMALVRIVQKTAGQALSAPVQGPDVKSAPAKIGNRLRMLFDEFRAAMEKRNLARPCRHFCLPEPDPHPRAVRRCFVADDFGQIGHGDVFRARTTHAASQFSDPWKQNGNID